MNQSTSVTSDRSYSILLLLGCIDALSRELSMHKNTDPEFISSEALLKQALQIQYQGVPKTTKLLEVKHGWLLDYIENLIY